jgi:hypothetical protein
MKTIIKTSVAYRSNEGGYGKLSMTYNEEDTQYKNAMAARAVLDKYCTKLSYSTTPIGGFTYEGEYEYITYEIEDTKLTALTVILSDIE